MVDKHSQCSEFINKSIDISFVVPCYNEEKNIEFTLKKIKDVLTEFELDYEIIIVDDGSEDNTYKIASGIKKNDQRIKLIRNKKNMGLGFTYKEAAFHANGKYYMLVNGDNSENNQYLRCILRHVGDADMIIPNFQENDNRRLIRRILSKCFVKMVNGISGCKLKYYNGAVLHERYNVMRYQPDTNGFAYQAELIVKLLYIGKSYIEVDVKNNDRDVKGGNIKSNAFKIKNLFSVTNSLTQIMIRRLRKILFDY